MLKVFYMHSDHLDANMIRSAKLNEHPCMKMTFFKHGDHLDANMIRSAKINDNPCMKTTLKETMKIHYVLKGITQNP